MKVLIVDDDRGILESFVRLLGATDPGVKVYTASNAQQAYATDAGSGPMDVVLCDYDLGLDQPKGTVIIENLRTLHPEADFTKWIIWSGLEREVPEWVAFYLKTDLEALLRLLRKMRMSRG